MRSTLSPADMDEEMLFVLLFHQKSKPSLLQDAIERERLKGGMKDEELPPGELIQSFHDVRERLPSLEKEGAYIEMHPLYSFP